VGIYLPRNVWEHGKLYVGFSRVRSPEHLRIVLIPDEKQGFDAEHDTFFTNNTVKRHLWDFSTERQLDPQGPLREVIPWMNRVNVSGKI
jgi:hypothetical protein